MKNFDSLARWPLLMGAVILFAVALWETSHDNASNGIAEVTTALASILLGAWIWSLAIEAERKHHQKDDDDGA